MHAAAGAAQRFEETVGESMLLGCVLPANQQISAVIRRDHRRRLVSSPVVDPDDVAREFSMVWTLSCRPRRNASLPDEKIKISIQPYRPTGALHFYYCTPVFSNISSNMISFRVTGLGFTGHQAHFCAPVSTLLLGCDAAGRYKGDMVDRSPDAATLQLGRHGR